MNVSELQIFNWTTSANATLNKLLSETKMGFMNPAPNVYTVLTKHL